MEKEDEAFESEENQFTVSLLRLTLSFFLQFYSKYFPIPPCTYFYYLHTDLTSGAS